jgi:hypothetical protein
MVVLRTRTERGNVSIESALSTGVTLARKEKRANARVADG